MNKEIYFLFFIGCFDKRILLMPPAINVFDVESLFTQSNKLKKKVHVLESFNNTAKRRHEVIPAAPHTFTYSAVRAAELPSPPPTASSPQKGDGSEEFHLHRE